MTRDQNKLIPPIAGVREWTDSRGYAIRVGTASAIIAAGLLHPRQIPGEAACPARSVHRLIRDGRYLTVSRGRTTGLIKISYDRELSPDDDRWNGTMEELFALGVLDAAHTPGHPDCPRSTRIEWEANGHRYLAARQGQKIFVMRREPDPEHVAATEASTAIARISRASKDSPDRYRDA